MGVGSFWPFGRGPVGFVPPMIIVSLVKCVMFLWGAKFHQISTWKI